MFTLEDCENMSVVKEIVLKAECWNRWDSRLPSASVLDDKKQGKIVYWQVFKTITFKLVQGLMAVIMVALIMLLYQLIPIFGSI